MEQRWIFTIKGKVQGVGFRASVVNFVKMAVPTVTGHVRNLINGDVEVVAEGTGEDLERLCQFCHEGPAAAEVRHLDISRCEAQGNFSDFSIEH